MDYEKSVQFKNWSSEDFMGSFAMAIPDQASAEVKLERPYKFEAGGTYNVPQSQALHFAKQLAIEQLHKHGYNGDQTRGEMLTDVDVKEYMDKCFPLKPVTAEEPNAFERVDVKDVPAVEAAPVKENTTEKDVQNEQEDDSDDNADDEKNNAGAPKFKRGPGRPRTRDAEYE